MALALGAWASWAAWRGPPPRPQPHQYQALARPPSKAIIDELQQAEQRLTIDIKNASIKLGRQLLIHELEGQNNQGLPHLKTPIPDNPLMSGISTMSEGCEPDTNTQADWLYCPSTGSMRAVIPLH